MKTKITILSVFFATAIAALLIVSCSKKFDAPPPYTIPSITANKTIAALKSGYTAGSLKSITDSTIISGIVIANDKSGNIYKQIFIQDSTGGLQLKLNGTNLYASYPVGMQVFIKCSGLVLSDYNNDIELGTIDNTNPNAPAVTGIPQTLFSQYIVTGSLNNTITPKVITLAQLSAAAAGQPASDALQNTLVQIANAEFASSDIGLVYADTSANKASVNRNLEDCAGGKTTLYSSGYASFAAARLPAGNGIITAVYVPYRTSSELLLRDTSDVQFTGTRCNGTVSPGTGDFISIANLRALYTGSNIALTSHRVSGVVISDAANKNISNGEVVIQSGNYGIAVYFGGTITYNIGDSIIVSVGTSDSLINYKGSLEIKTASGTTKPTPVATGITVTPQVKTIGDLNTALASSLGSPGNIEFTLVTLAGVTSPGGTYSGNKTITDATGNITLYTTSTATFASNTLPTGSTNFTGYGSNYNTTSQFQIRNTTDVSGGTPGGGGGSQGSAISIADLRALYNGTGITLNSYQVGGIVISDAANKNISTGDVILQSGGKGISVYFGGTISYNIGDSIIVSVSAADSLISYKGSLEIKMHSGATKPSAVVSNVTVTPQVKTISELNTALSANLGSPDNIEYTLVKIVGATAPVGTYSGSKTITDATGSITLYTASGATFSATALPTGSKTFVGYANTFNTTKEFQIRNTNDVN